MYCETIAVKCSPWYLACLISDSLGWRADGGLEKGKEVTDKLTSVASSYRCSTIGRTTNDLGHIHDGRVLVTDWDVDDTLMCEVWKGSEHGGFLTTVLGRRADDDGGHFTVESLFHPELPCCVEEGGDLRDGATVTRGECENERVIVFQICWLNHGDVFFFCRGVHLGEDILGERFCAVWRWIRVTRDWIDGTFTYNWSKVAVPPLALMPKQLSIRLDTGVKACPRRRRGPFA